MPILLQLNTSVGCGSTGRIAETIASLEKERGWDCYIAHGSRYVGKTEMHAYQVSNIVEEHIHYAKSLLCDAHGLGSKRATKRLVEWIKKLNPDVIHLHNLHGYWINYEILFDFLKESAIPIVWTFHDCWPITGHCVHFASKKCDKWKKHCENCPGIKTYPKAIIDRTRRNFELKKRIFTSVNNITIVPVSHWLEGVIEDSFMNNYPRVVIQNGIDLNTFYPHKASQKKIREKYCLGDKFVIMSVASKWHRDNGLYDFVKLRSLLESQYEIVLVGVTAEQRNKLPKGITGVTRTNSKQELAELYTAADIVVTAQVEASFGLVTLEAMACGTPVIVYNSTACPEIVTKTTGFVIPPKDIRTMRDTIIRYSNEKEKCRYSQACIEHVSLFNEEVSYEKYIELYDSLI